MTDPRHAPIRTGNPPADTTGGHADADRVRDMLRATDPAGVATGAAAYDDAARRLAELRDLLFHLVRRHAEDPEAEASPSLAALRRLHSDAEHLLASARAMGEALRAYGGEILPWYVENAPDHGTPPDDVDQYMRRLNARITELWHAFPEKIDGAADAPPPPRRRGVHLASADPASPPATDVKDEKDDKDGKQHDGQQSNQTVVPMIGIPMGAMMGGGRGGGGGGSRSRSRKAPRRKMDVPSPAIKPAPGLIPDREPRILTTAGDTRPKPAAAAPRIVSPVKPSLPAMPPAPEPGKVPPVSVAESLTAQAKAPAAETPSAPPVPQSPIAEALSAPKTDKPKD